MKKCAICEAEYADAYDGCPECMTGLAKCVVQIKSDVRFIGVIVALGIAGAFLLGLWTGVR